jgi:hypothetical protein
MPSKNAPRPAPASCRGHESTDGPIGNVIYCDGTCRRVAAAPRVEVTYRVTLQLTSDEVALLASAVVILRERQSDVAERTELDVNAAAERVDATRRIAERARALAGKVSRAVERARGGS